MSSEKWKQINDLFHAALEISPPLRPDFLKQQCTDPSVLQEVASLLDAHRDAGSFIETPIVPSLLSGEEPEELLDPGQLVGQYKILYAIGRGGMGAVYLGVRADEAYEKQVAIKIVKRGMDSTEILKHFRTERQILADFDHPNIARLIDGGTTDFGVPYFVMEFVEGMPIDAYCDHHRLNVNERLELFRQVCSAVAYAHRRLVIHRDIKPSNIFVTKDGVPKLLDFGIAKILDTNREAASTATGLLLMTPEYASPEQAMGLTVTTVTDVYSLGVLLYEILTGRHPYEFEGRSPLEIVRVINDTQPLLPSAAIVEKKAGSANTTAAVIQARSSSEDQLKRRLRGDLDNIVWMALRKEPQRRYQSVEQFSEDIRRHLVGLPVVARKDTIVYRLTKFTKRNRIAVAAAVLILISLIGGVITTTWQARIAKAEQARAEYAREFADELRYLESLLLNTYSAPLHNIRPGLDLARKRLKEMERRMLKAGPLAFGAGHNAIGNGYLLLKEYELAKTHLEQAWNSGYREPSTAYSLGKALGNLYHQSLIAANRISNRAARDQRRREAEQKFAHPAVAFLSQARTNAESPAYIEGLILLYQDRFSEALNKAAEALPYSSRPQEVMKLEGDIHYQIAASEHERGNNDAAIKAYKIAGDSYDRASRISRSDAEIYLADAQRISRLVSLRATESDDLIQTALDLCDKAIQINPDSRAFLTKSEVYAQQGINEMYHVGEDPRPAFLNSAAMAEQALKHKQNAAAYEHLARAYLRIGEYETTNAMDSRNSLNASITNAKKAIALEPQSPEGFAGLASANFYLAEYQLNHGDDPTASLKEIIRIYEQNLGGYPKDTFLLNLVALTHVGLAEYGMKRGMDPRPDLQKSLKYFDEGLKKNPSALNLYASMGVALMDLGKYEMTIGKSPDHAFEAGITAYEKVLVSFPDSYGMFNRGLIYLSRAEHKVRTRQDPTTDLDSALKDFQRIIHLYPDFPHSYVQKGAVAALTARHQFLNGKDPRDALARADRILTEFLHKDQTNHEAYLLRGATSSLAARWNVQNGKSADPLWNKAISDLKKCIELNRLELAAYAELASVFRWMAVLKDDSPSNVWIDQGLQITADAEKMHSNHPEILAIRGTLLVLKGRSGNAEATQQGEELLKKALELNEFLRWDYGSGTGQ